MKFYLFLCNQGKKKELLMGGMGKIYLHVDYNLKLTSEFVKPFDLYSEHFERAHASKLQYCIYQQPPAGL